MKKPQLNFFHKKNFALRSVSVIFATIMMGFALSWLLLIDLGADPCTAMNHAISEKLGLSLGNWQAIFNSVLLLLVLLFGGRNLGVGTLANMFLVGYSIDFFTWLWGKLLPAEFFTLPAVRCLVLVPALALFVLAAAVYMGLDMGTAPYDAISFIISSKISKLSFRNVRKLYDFVVIGIACCFGGRIQIVTVLMAVTLGPVVEWVSSYGKKVFPKLFADESETES